MVTTTNVKQLKLNIMTQAQYDSATKNPNELYMLTDAEAVTVDSALSSSSKNPVQNKVINSALNDKQNTLVSGTNIRTVNGDSLLGSGNIVVQEKLTSGTNIKTINNQSLLGSGDISIGSPSVAWGDITGTLSNQTDLDNALDAKQDSLVSGTNIKTINSTSLLGSGNIIITGLPSQSGQNGKYLTTNGTSASWSNVTPNIDSSTITTNANSQLQTVGVIEQKASSTIKFWVGTESDYNAIVTKDANTLYFIKE